MNPDCRYCGFKDGANIEHECLGEKPKMIIDRIVEDYHKEWARAEHYKDQLEAYQKDNQNDRKSKP